MKKRSNFCLPALCYAAILALFCAGTTFASAQKEQKAEIRIVTDQLGRTVSVPVKVDNAVVLQHQTLNIIVQLDAADKVTGILSSWKRQLGTNYARLAPRLETLPMPGDLSEVNIESLLAIQPQVVFVTNYAPPEMIEQIDRAGLPVIAISLREDEESERAKINPIMEDEETAYNNGLKTGIRLIGEVLDRKKEAEDLINYAFSHRKIVEDRIKDIRPEQRVRTYMANPNLNTYGSGKYTGLMMIHAGAMNVAAATIEGAKQVSMEQILAWNPDVIFVQERYPDVVTEINSSPAWKPINAVKNGRVYLMPEYAKAWGYPQPEALAIGELWMAKKLYPDRFADIDTQKEANDYYERFYRTPYQGE
jgi:iron complex transport system substrate-binding protein